MVSPLRPAGLQLHPSAPSAPLRQIPAPSKDTHSVPLPLEASVNDPIISAAAQVPDNPLDGEDHDQARPGIPPAITRRLYLSHFFSTWNSRSFEFGAVLFLASIFPKTLLPLSIYALVRSASAILLAPVIGRAIDRRSRLSVVRFSVGKLPSFTVGQDL